MKPSRAAQKEIQNDSRLLRAWKRWHAEQLAIALQGPHGAIVAEIVDFLSHKMTPKSAPQLLKILQGHDWRLVDADVRLVILHEINNASARLREHLKLPPFDDSLPGEQPTLFELVRALLDPSSVPSCP
jgi:hypothetical protein